MKALNNYCFIAIIKQAQIALYNIVFKVRQQNMSHASS